MADAISDLLNSLGFFSDTLTIRNIAGLFIFILCLNFVGELVYAVIGRLKK